MKKISLILFLIVMVLISSCTKQEVVKVTCNEPYILVGVNCCLDKDNNSICDKDEIKEEQPQTIETTPKEDVGSYFFEIKNIIEEGENIRTRFNNINSQQESRWRIYNAYDRKFCGDLEEALNDTRQVLKDFQTIQSISEYIELNTAIEEWLKSEIEFQDVVCRYDCMAKNRYERDSLVEEYNKNLDEKRDKRREVNKFLALAKKSNPTIEITNLET